MDFKQLVGKQLVWSGTFPDAESDEINEYILFDNGSVVKLANEGSGEPSMLLDHGLDVLNHHLSTAKPFADNVLALVAILEKLVHKPSPTVTPTPEQPA